MQKFIIQLAVLSGLCLSGCAHPADDTIVVLNPDRDTLAVLEPETATPHPQTSSNLSEPELTPSQIKIQNMPQPSQEYWVIRPGTVVYNAAREPVRSLRLQP